MREQFQTFLIFVVVAQIATFPSFKIDKAMFELHFYRTKNEGNIILATAFFDRNITRNGHNSLLKQRLPLCFS